MVYRYHTGLMNAHQCDTKTLAPESQYPSSNHIGIANENTKIRLFSTDLFEILVRIHAAFGWKRHLSLQNNHTCMATALTVAASSNSIIWSPIAQKLLRNNMRNATRRLNILFYLRSEVTCKQCIHFYTPLCRL